MPRFRFRAFSCFVLLSAAALAPGWCQTPPAGEGEVPTLTETIQVTATRVPEDVEGVPASVTIITGDELRARGATDLPSALALAAGVSVAPGGDGGPAASVPEIWGLREFDAFLLVVDGVPWGGAFNPDLPTLDLNGVERIEILRGAAPVLYGATSFTGVIHVLHHTAGEGGRAVQVSGGSYGSGGAAVSLALPGAGGGFSQSLNVDADRQGFKDDRTGYDRGHVLYRAARKMGTGSFHLDVDGTVVRQDPASPHPRTGRVLSPLVPLDANYNPSDAKVDQKRFQVAGGYDRPLGRGDWSTTLALTRSERDTVRGFLTGVSTSSPNARGYEQDLEISDVYFDTHFALRVNPELQIVTGLDHLIGKAEGEAEDFDYFVPLSGHGAPSSSSVPRRVGFEVEDERNFSGLYLQAEWNPLPRWRFQLGARLNRTVEDREAGEEEITGGVEEEEGEEEGSDSRTLTRGSGSAGVSFLAWDGGPSEGLWLFADYRDTYKPAAIDFGPEAEPEILEPETAQSWEVGAKGRLAGGRFDWEVSAFQMDFENVVLSQVVNGLPALVNGGKERFRGVELETRFRLRPDLHAQLNYALHDARFKDFLREFDGVPTQLDGNRFEMSARHLGSAGLIYAPAHGFLGSLVYEYVGERFLNARNTALAPDYSVWSAGVGYRFAKWDLRLDGRNLNDTRPPVAESELGDAQYYRLPARSFRLTLGMKL